MVEGMPPFEEVYKEFQPNCYKWANYYKRVYPRINHDVEDLAQEARVGLWQAYETCTDWTTFPKYAETFMKRRVASYCRINNYQIRLPYDNRLRRKVKAYKFRSLDEPLLSDEEGNKTVSEVVKDDSVDVENEVVQADIDRIFGEELAKLPDDEFSWMCLSLTGANVSETSKERGMSKYAGGYIVSKAKKHLREGLAERGVTAQLFCS